MLLAQQGKVSLDDPMRKYLSELPESAASVTIRHVISHIGGMRDWRGLAEFGGMPEGTYVYRNEDLLQLAARQRALNFDPGTHYSYSNIGYNISTILVARALGDAKTFQTFTRDQIFEPLGMSHTRWRDNFRTVVPNRALAYRRSNNVWNGLTPIENIIGAGGMLTTVGDLLLWNENFTHAKVGGPDFVKAQQTPAVLSGGRTIAYAAGLAIATVDGFREVAHSGSTGGYRTWLGRYPDQSVSVAVLCNSAHANAAALGRRTARLWTGATPTQSLNSTYNADPAKLQSLAGVYRNTRNNMVGDKLVWRNGKLALDSGTELIPVAPGKFLTPASDVEFRFEEASPLRLTVVNANGETLYERVEPAHPTAAEFAQYIGRYESSDTNSTLAVAVGTQPGELTYCIGSNEPARLRPTFRDAFATPSGSSIRFNRDEAGKVISLSVGDDRVWDLRFTRVR